MSDVKVALVGAGPGDPGLITTRGLELLKSADVVIYDRLVNPEILRQSSPDAELIDVGKRPGNSGRSQAEINNLLVAIAGTGRLVVRLKGGDPFVFGRGGEEAAWLNEHGVAFEIVPGVTSAIAAPAYAGIPLTHRDVASSFTVVTASESPNKPDSFISWDKIAQEEGTVVVMMGWRNLANVSAALIKYGRHPDTPVAVVQWGTEPRQRTVVGTLHDIDGKTRNAGLSAPVVVIVGDVVSLRQTLRWFDDRPLFGQRVLVTRTESQVGNLSRMLRKRGAQPIELPTIDVRPLEDYGPLDRALGQLYTYDWVVFTSVNAVDAVFARLAANVLDTRAFGNAKVAAIGSATSKALSERGLIVDLTPEIFTSNAIVAALRDQLSPKSKLLLPRADIAPEPLIQSLSLNGAHVDHVTAYRTVAPKTTAKRLDSILTTGIEVATFTSSSTVRHLLDAIDGKIDRISDTTIACIGPVTAETAREMGLKVDIVADVHTVAGLVEALERHLAKETSYP